MTDLMPAVSALVALASAAMLAAIPAVVPLLRRALGLHMTAAQAQLVDAAVRRAAGLAREVILTYADKVARTAVHNTALAVGVDYVTRRVPDALQALGLTPEHVQEMVHAELARDGYVASGGNVTEPTKPDAAAASTSGIGSAAAKVLGVCALFAVVAVGAGALSGCATPAQTAHAERVACQVDGALMPVAQSALTAAGGPAAVASNIDAVLVHPTIVAACAQLGGTAVAAPVLPATASASPTPAATAVAPASSGTPAAQ